MKKEQIRALRGIFGCLSAQKTRDQSARRRIPDQEDEDALVQNIRPFAVDYDNKLLPAQACRRLAFKTQVWTEPWNSHVRTRGSHTDEVVSVSTMIGGILGLNTDLCRAIAAGHDIGHPPFGHLGENFISSVTKKPFRHEVFGVVIAQHIERRGRGLNLTHQVLSGMLEHPFTKDGKQTRKRSPESLVVMYADKIAYITADWNDFSRMIPDLPQIKAVRQDMESLGRDRRERINSLVTALCLESAARGRVIFEESDEAKLLFKVRSQFLPIYRRLNAVGVGGVLEKVYTLIVHSLPEVNAAVALALLTDCEAIDLGKEISLGIQHLLRTSIGDLLPVLEKPICYNEPDLAW